MLKLTAFLVAILTALGLLVANKYYINKHNSQVDSLIVLTSTNYGEWGMMPNINNATIQTTFNFSSCQNGECKPNVSLIYAEKSKYQNITLSSGNTGKLLYYKKNQLKRINKKNETNIVLPNIGLIQNIERQKLSPAQRVIPLMFSKVFKSIIQFIPRFFALTIWEYKFKSEAFRISVYKNANINQQIFKQLQNKKQGLSNIQGLTKWVQIVLYYNLNSSNKLMNLFQLKQQQMNSLIGQESVLHNIIATINQTINLKTQSELCSDIYCSNQQLAIYQWIQSGLTNQQIIQGVNLNAKTISIYNSSLGFAPQISVYAQQYNYKFLSINDGTALTVGDSSMFQFQNANFLVQNMDIPQLLDTHFITEETSQTYTSYFNYLVNLTKESYFSQVLLVYPYLQKQGSQLAKSNFFQLMKNQQTIKQIRSILIKLNGGEFIQTSPQQHLFNNSNPFRKMQQIIDPLQGGTPWLNQISFLFNKSDNTQVQRNDVDIMGSGLFSLTDLRVHTQKYGLKRMSLQYPLYNKKLKVKIGDILNSSDITGIKPQPNKKNNIKIFDQFLKQQIQFVFKQKKGNQVQYICNSRNLLTGQFYFNNLDFQIDQCFLTVDYSTGLTLYYRIDLSVKTIVKGKQQTIFGLRRNYEMNQKQKQAVFSQLQRINSQRKAICLTILFSGLGIIIILMAIKLSCNCITKKKEMTLLQSDI